MAPTALESEGARGFTPHCGVGVSPTTGNEKHQTHYCSRRERNRTLVSSSVKVIVFQPLFPIYKVKIMVLMIFYV